MVRIFILLGLMVSCVPRSVTSPDKRSLTFTIQPEGIWKGICIDDVPMTAQSGVVISGQKKTVEFLANDRIKFTTDFISGSCADTVHKVQLRHVMEGTVSYKDEHRDLNEDVRLRGFSLKINREYHQAKTKAGLEFIQTTRELGMNSRVGDTVEIDSDDFFFTEAEGVFAVKKNARNIMNIFTDTRERMNSINDDVIEKNLTHSNLYVRNVIK